MYSSQLQHPSLQNIVHDIKQTCLKKKVDISEDIILFYVKLVTLDPKWNIKPDQKVERDDVHRLIKYCVSSLTEDTANVCTLRMQYYFYNNYLGRKEMIKRNREAHNNMLNPLLTDILQSSQDAPPREVTNKIIMFTVLHSGLGNPTEEYAIKEAEKALSSIFDANDMAVFLSNSKQEREATLKELTELVAGIRIFNRDCKKGGHGIDDLPRIMIRGITTLSNGLQKSLLNTMGKVNMLTAALYKCYPIGIPTPKNTFRLNRNVSEEMAATVKKSLVVMRQYELYTRRLLEDVEATDKSGQDVFDEYENTLNTLNDTVELRTAIPVVHVFPLFVKLASTWYGMQDITILLSHIARDFLYLRKCAKPTRIDKAMIMELLSDSEILTDAQRNEKALPHPPIKTDRFARQHLYLEPQTLDMESMSFRHLGFCLPSFVKTDGGLFPGNPKLGAVKQKDRLYLFASVDEMEDFGTDPLSYNMRACQICRNHPEFIHMFNVEEYLVSVRDKPKLEPPGHKLRRMPEYDVEEDETQTEEDMMLLREKDPKYSSNLWDHRRMALRMATLTRGKTDAVGDSKSYVSAYSQTHDMINVTCQTKKDNYTNVPKLQTYLYGLRGQKEDKFHIIDLTRPTKD